MKRTPILVVISVAGLLALAGCGGESSTTDGAGSSTGGSSAGGAGGATGGAAQDAGVDSGGSGGTEADASTDGEAGQGGTTQDAAVDSSQQDATPDATHEGGPGPHDARPDAFDCDAARAKYKPVFDEAVACNPSLSVVQCTDQLLVTDLCGCAVAANITQPKKAKKAQQMFKNLIEAHNCLLPCGKPCYQGHEWACGSTAKKCIPGPK